jgi:hypothetical protein
MNTILVLKISLLIVLKKSSITMSKLDHITKLAAFNFDSCAFRFMSDTLEFLRFLCLTLTLSLPN